MKAHAFFRKNVIVVLMDDVMTLAERNLVASGERDGVLSMRRRLKLAMRPQLVAAVESLTGGKVTAFMSDNHIEPDMAVELFVLDRPAPAEPVNDPAEGGDPVSESPPEATRAEDLGDV
jgi:uncharacterized protein YbcI